MKKNLTLLFLILSFQFSFAQGSWTSKGTIGGTGRYEACGYSIGNLGYMCCGGTLSTWMNDLWEYDPASNLWTQKASLPGTPRSFGAGFSIGNYLYIGTGQTSGGYVNDFWQYNSTNNSWLQKGNFPGAGRRSAIGFSIGNLGYMGTGDNIPSGYFKDFYEYDPSTDSWTPKPNYPGVGKTQCCAFSLGNKGYVGWGSYSCCWSSSNDFWEYNPLTSGWTAKANFPGAGLQNPVSFVICNNAYCGVGDDGQSPYPVNLYKYNPVTNQWIQKANFPGVGRDDVCFFTIGNHGYCGTGQNVSYLNDWWEYTPDSLCIGLPAAGFISSDTTFCGESGKCIDFTDHSTNSPTSWKWYFPGANPDTSTQQNPTNICYSIPGTYAVKLVASNSTGSDSITVSPMITFATSAAAPVLSFSGDTIFCSHAAAYQWYFNGALIAGATDSFYVAAVDGIYAVEITDGNGCTRLSDGFPESVNDLNGWSWIKIYPNPAGSQFSVSGLKFTGGSKLEIFNVLGEKVLQSEISDQKSEIDISSFVKGIYFIKINGNSCVLRLVKIG